MSSKELKTLLKEAREAINKKDFRTSLSLCKKILSDDRENYMALVFLGLSLQEVGMNEKVLPTFKKAIQIAPNNILAWNGLANYYEKLGTDEAQMELIEIYISLLNLESDDRKINELCEKLRLFSVPDSNFTTAIETLWKIVQNEQVSEATVTNACTSLVYIISKRTDFSQCRHDIYEKALSVVLTNENLVTRQYYGEYVKTLYHNKRYDTLFKVAEQMFTLYSTDLTSIKWMCRTYSELMIEENEIIQDKHIQVEKYCDILLSLESDSSIGFLTKAVFHSESHNFLKAVQLLQKVTASKPNLLHPWILLGFCYLKLHIYNSASVAALKAQQISQSNDNFHANLLERLNNLLPEALSRSSEDEYLQEAINFCFKKLNDCEEPKIYISLIRSYISLENVAQAKTYLSKLQNVSNERTIFTLLSAQLLHKQKLFKEALELLEKNDSNLSEWWCEIGTLYCDLELFEKSLVPFLKAAKLDPNCYIYFIHLGNYYKKVGDIDKARRCYEKACRLNEKCIEAIVELSNIYRLQKNWNANVTILKNLTGSVLNPENRWAWLQLGLNFLEQEDYANATETLRLVVRANPNDSHCWESLADAYMARGAYTSALKCYQKAAEIMPNSLYPLLQVANIKQALGEFAEAHTDYESILKSNKRYVPALKGLAETCILQARQFKKNQRIGLARDYSEKALDMATIAIRQRNDLSCLWKLVGDSCVIVANLPDKYCCMLVLKGLAESVPDEGNIVLEREELFVLAERCYHKALAMMQNKTKLWYDLAACYLSHAQNCEQQAKPEIYYSKAANIIQHCVSLEPSCWQHWNLMGVIAFIRDKKDYALAQHAFIKAVTTDNSSYIAWSNLGTLYLILGHAKLANEAFSQAQRADPNYVNSWIGQAMIAESLGLEDAMDLFRHSTLLAVHPQGAIGYGNWVCHTLLDMPPHTVIYSIHNMHAIPIACDAMTWYTDQNPEDPCGWNMLGLLKERMGLKNDATSAFRNALRLCTNEIRDKVTINYGRMLFKLQNYKQAIRMFEDVEEATFNSGSGLALSLFKDKQYEESYEKYEQALHWLTEEQTHQSDLLVALASIVYMFQGPDPAKTLLFQSTELNPPSHYGFYATLALGLIHGDRNLAKLVVKELHKLRDVTQCLPHYASLVCHTYLLEDRPEIAIREVSKLIHRHPDHASLWLTLSILLIRSYKKRPQSISAAAKCAQIAVTLGRTNMDVAKVLCVASLASLIVGDYHQALISAQKAIHCYPNIPECWAVFISSILMSQKKSMNLSKRALLEKSVQHFKENLEATSLLNEWLEKTIIPNINK